MNNKKSVIFLLSLLFVSIFVFFYFINLSNKRNISFDASKKIKIATSIYPLYSLTSAISGDKADLVLILPPGASPHTFDILPSKLRSLRDVDIFFSIGLGLDSWLDKFSNVANNSEIFNVSNSINLRSFSGEFVLDNNSDEHEDYHEHEDVHKHEDDQEHKHGEFDPHYWLSPENSKIIAENIYKKLSQIDPINKNYYYNNYLSFLESIDNKNLEWQEKLGSLENRNIVVFHDAWFYFSEHFNLKVVSSFEPFPGKSPSPQYIIDLQKKIKDNNISALFVEPQLSKDLVSSLASDLGIEVVVLDPLGGVEGRMSYIELIDYNVNTIYEFLK